MLHFLYSLAGGNVFLRMNQTDHLAEVDVKDYLYQIVLGLEYLHSNGIVHEDLKPENIVFEKKNSNLLKIVDLGLAKYNIHERFPPSWGTRRTLLDIQPAGDMWRLGQMTFRS